MQGSVLSSDTAVLWPDFQSEEDWKNVWAAPGKTLVRDKLEVAMECCYIKVKYIENKIMKPRMRFGGKADKNHAFLEVRAQVWFLFVSLLVSHTGTYEHLLNKWINQCLNSHKVLACNTWPHQDAFWSSLWFTRICEWFIMHADISWMTCH